jgi:fibronectin-binding autotransporter adhesin
MTHSTQAFLNTPHGQPTKCSSVMHPIIPNFKIVLALLSSIKNHSRVSLKKKSRLLLVVIMMLFSPFSLREAHSADILWNVGDGVWNTAANWFGGVVPGASDTAVFNIPGGGIVTLNAPVIVGGIRFGSLGVAPPGYVIEPNGQTLTIGTGGLNNQIPFPSIPLFFIPAGNVTFNSGNVVETLPNHVDFTLNGPTASLNFSGTSNAGSLVIGLQPGTLTFHDTSSAENAFVSNNAGGLVDISGTTDGTSIGYLNGNGNVELGGKTLTLENLNIDTQIGDGTAGNGIISGVGGSLIKTGTGNLTLGGANTYTGGTTITGGTLTGTTTSLTGNILDNAALVFNQAGNGTFAGNISGAGTFTKLGGGEVTLSGTNTYTGGTTITGGTLINNGSLVSMVTVNPGATYAGNGISGSLFNGGTVSPGNSIGTLMVNGNYNQTSTGTLLIEIAPQGLSDLLSITGGAILGGTLNIVPVGSIMSFGDRVYTFLTANGGVNGTFSNIIAPALLHYNVRYLADAVVIDTEQLLLTSLVQSGNPGIIAGYIDQIIAAGTVSADLDTVLQALETIAGNGNAALAKALEQISPDPYRELGNLAFEQTNLLRETAGSQLQRILDTLVLCQLGTHTASKELVSKFQQLQNDIRMGLPFKPQRGITQKMANKQFGAHALAADNLPLNKMVNCGKTNIWIQSFGGLQDKKNSNRLAGTKSGAFGTALGAEVQVLPNTYIGVMGGGMGTDFDWKQSRGKGNIKSYYGGIYGLWLSKENIYVDGQATLSVDNYHTHRNINFGTINRRASEKHNGLSVSADLELGYLWTIEQTVIQPFLNYAYMASHENKFRERGAGSLNIHRSGQTSQFGRSELGSLFSSFFTYGETLIYPSLKLSWVQKRPFQGKKVKFNFANQNFGTTVFGDNRVRNLLDAGISLTAQFKGGIYVTGNVNGEVGSGEKSGTFQLSLRYPF